MQKPFKQVYICTFVVFALLIHLYKPGNAFGATITSTFFAPGGEGSWSNPIYWSSTPIYPNNGNGGNEYNVVSNGGIINLTEDITINEGKFTHTFLQGTTTITIRDHAEFTQPVGGGTITVDPTLMLSGKSFFNGIVHKQVINSGELDYNRSSGTSVTNLAGGVVNLGPDSSSHFINQPGGTIINLSSTRSGGSFVNNGTVKARGMLNAGPYRQESGKTIIENGEFGGGSSSIYFDGGELAGNGIFESLTIDMGADSVLSPGYIEGDIGELSWSGTLLRFQDEDIFEARGGQYVVDIAGTGSSQYDKLIISSSIVGVNLSNMQFVLNDLAGFNPSSTDIIFPIINNSSNRLGEISAYPSGSWVPIGTSYMAKISYNGDFINNSITEQGNDLALYNIIPIPEPAMMTPLFIMFHILRRNLRRKHGMRVCVYQCQRDMR